MENEVDTKTEQTQIVDELGGNKPIQSESEDKAAKQKISGISELSFDADNLKEAVVSAGGVPPVKKAKPLFFIGSEDRTTIEVDVLTHPETGRVMSVTKTGYGIDFENGFSFFVHTVLKFTFSIPNYIQISEYRRRSTSLDPDTQTPIIDHVKMREFFLINHLKEWNLTDENGDELPITFDDNGLISDSSLIVAHSLSPAIMDVVFTIFERDVILT